MKGSECNCNMYLLVSNPFLLCHEYRWDVILEHMNLNFPLSNWIESNSEITPELRVLITRHGNDIYRLYKTFSSDMRILLFVFRKYPRESGRFGDEWDTSVIGLC
jgi:hypothetical protein